MSLASEQRPSAKQPGNNRPRFSIRKAQENVEVRKDDVDIARSTGNDVMADYGGFLRKRNAERNNNEIRATDMSALDLDGLCD